MGGESAVASFLGEQVRERFLLYRSERVVRNRSADVQERVRRLVTAAKLRLATARELDDPASIPAAVPLYREAALLLITALRSARDTSFADPLMAPEAAWQWLDTWRTTPDARPAPADFEVALVALTDSDLLRLDRLDAEAAQREHAALDRTTRWLQSSIEPRSLSEIKWTRAGRLLAVLGVLVALLVVAALSLFAPDNLAGGKSAQASSRFPGTPEAGGVTNGDIESTFGVHTQKEDKAWVSVDLGEEKSVGTVKVHNRADGFQHEILPLVLELSKNGVDWQAVSSRNTPFTSSDPWVWHGAPSRARHVRVRRLTPGYIALTEIKVFAD